MAWRICLFFILMSTCSDANTGSIFEHIKDSILKLEKDFNTSESDIADNGSIFTRRFSSGLWTEANEKKILLAQMISMYSDMLKNKTKTQTPGHLRELIEALEQYKTQFSESLKKANDIIEVANLPMNDVKIQRKAVAEMYHVLSQVNVEEIKRLRRSRGQNPRKQKRHIPNFRG
ncbi:interferon gamma [Thamnophis elegans]|uniref:interferon gamma n=1 Tax=Thamnophis elegans TaxID=35005 RepID=UPI00137800EB|nr:interferon gamma [Thamnophis elegans]